MKVPGKLSAVKAKPGLVSLLYGAFSRDPDPNPDPAMNRRNPYFVPTCMDAKA
jgi:hypothetical protein